MMGKIKATLDTCKHFKGPWHEVLASTAREYKYLCVTYEKNGHDEIVELDFGLGLACVEVSLFGSQPIEPGSIYPVYVPAGMRLSVRAKTTKGGNLEIELELA